MEKNVRKPTHEKPVMNVLHREKMFRAMFDNAAVGMAHVNLDGSFFDVNAKFCEITGYTHDELLQRTFQEITHPDDLDADLEQAGQLARGGIDTYSMEKRYLRKDGSIIWINLTASVVLDDGGDALYFIAVIEDIPERLAAEEKAREPSRFMDLIFRHCFSSLVLTDRNFNFIRVNEVYAKSCGREVSEFPGRNHFEMFPSDFEQVWREAREARKPWQAFGRPFVFPDHPEWGVTFWNIALVPMLDDAGEVVAFLFSLNEVTEMKRTEEELRQRPGRAFCRDLVLVCGKAYTRQQDYL